MPQQVFSSAGKSGHKAPPTFEQPDFEDVSRAGQVTSP